MPFDDFPHPELARAAERLRREDQARLTAWRREAERQAGREAEWPGRPRLRSDAELLREAGQALEAARVLAASPEGRFHAALSELEDALTGAARAELEQLRCAYHRSFTGELENLEVRALRLTGVLQDAARTAMRLSDALEAASAEASPASRVTFGRVPRAQG